MYKVYLEIDEIEHKILKEPDEIRLDTCHFKYRLV